MKHYFLIFLSFFILLACKLPAQEIQAIRKRISQGDSTAMLELAEAFKFGFNVKENQDSSQYWAQKAAKKGYPDAQYLLGVSYLKNLFKQAEYDKGIVWLKKAAGNGNANACIKLREIYLERGKDVYGSSSSAKYYSTKKAFSYAQAAAENGSIAGSMLTGEAMILGKGTSKDIKKGLEFLEFAALEKKVARAQVMLGKYYFEGNITGKKELSKSLELFKAAYQNSKSSFEIRTEADILLHETNRYFKNVHNIMMQTNPALPAGTFDLPVRE